MTRTEPLRRITLQLRQIFFTEARTFIVDSSYSGSGLGRSDISP